ncbi:hypothetical protein [Actinosynnema sp. NPDC020468]|uniref:hypothetical protein n=1 Tax=Actinosynnema sp. NPDC020468 TaxID=3154488 RepID=UPI0033F820BC
MVALLGDPRVADVREDLVWFLAEVVEVAVYCDEACVDLANPPGRDLEAEVAAWLEDPDGDDSLYEDEVRANGLLAWSAMGCRDAVPAVLEALLELESDPDPAVRDAVGRTVVACRSVLSRD